MYCRLAVLMAEKDPRLTQRRLSKETKLSVTTVNRLHNNDFERLMPQSTRCATTSAVMWANCL